MICEKCKYWSPAPPGDREMEGRGYCHRYPPPCHRRNESTIWPPETGAGAWCGEGKEKEEKPHVKTF